MRNDVERRGEIDTIAALGMMEQRLDELNTMLRTMGAEKIRLLERISNLKQQEGL